MAKGSGLSQALNLFHRTVQTVPAYALFLKKNKVNTDKIKTEDDFKKVPLMDRDNYLKIYPLTKLVPHGRIPPMVSMSSGSSGKPYFWPRNFSQDERGGKLHIKIFNEIYGIKKQEPTLVVICFSMGSWIAGTFTLASCQWIAKKGYDLTVVTPGIELKDTVNILRDLAPNFKNVILAGYPPFLMDVVHAMREEKVKKLNLFLLTAGEGFSEKWRETIIKLSGMPNDPTRVISIYGSADADALGHETPLTIFLRQKANKKVKDILFGDQDSATLIQYYPQDRYFEEVKGHLVFTTNAGIPLIRYKIRDSGKVFPYEKVLEILKANGLLGKARPYLKWQLPFVVLGRRADVSVSFYALNIYFDNFKTALEDSSISKFLTGKFFAATKHSKNLREQKLVISVELAPKVKPSAELSEKIQRVVFENLIVANMEYRKLYSSIGEKAKPEIKLYPYGHQDFQIKKAKLNFRR